MKSFYLTLLWVFGQVALAAESLDTIIIDAGYDKQTRIAVVPFQQGPEFDNMQAVSEIVGFDLSRSGQFAPLARDDMLSLPTEPSQVFFRDWRILGVEYLLVGSTSTLANGNTVVRYYLFDVFNERQMATREVSGTRAQWRDIAHRISDDVFEAITGIKGAFSTRILYVLAKNSGSPSATYSLEMADSDGERSRTLFSSNEPIMSASWAPDGRTRCLRLVRNRPALYRAAGYCVRFPGTADPVLRHQRLSRFLAGWSADGDGSVPGW